VSLTQSSPEVIQTVAGPVEARLREVLDAEIERWSAVDPDLATPLRAMERFLLGSGKRLRPAFCHWAFVGAGGEAANPSIIDAGAAFELLHAFALIHDDVMDGSATRRRAPTLHIEFADVHGREQWRGEARQFGDGVAILVGDLACVYADRLLVGTPPEARQIWDELKIELNVGQYLDVLGTARAGTDLAAARRIARYKSGKYTIERPLHLGAALAGRAAELAAPLNRYGSPLGEAFQLRDDLLGTFGDSERTGKPVGDDLREGKPTPLLAEAAARIDDRSDQDLLARVGAPDLDDAEVLALQDLLTRSGARAEVERSIRDLTDLALAALGDAPIDDEARRALEILAHYVAEREH
jgi:geranylgeranyl diphosphate synthase type I